jgi:hypothetical protein
MKQLEEIYEELHRYNIPVVDVNFDEMKAGIITNGKDTVIAVDYKKISNSKEEKRIIAEEKAHYETGTFYSFNADKATIDKMEYKANKRVYNELIPYDELKAMCEKEMSVVELSDHFGIPIQDVLIAQFLYTNIENYKEA